MNLSPSLSVLVLLCACRSVSPQAGDTSASPSPPAPAGPEPHAAGAAQLGPAGAPATTPKDSGAADEQQPRYAQTLASEQAWPVAVRLTATHVYWANWGSHQLGAIARIPKEGGQVEFLTMSRNLPDSLYLDDRFAYWTERMGGALQRIPLAGGQSEVLHSSTSLLNWVLGDDAIYFSGAGSADIVFMPKSGGEEHTFVVPNDTDATTHPLSVRVHATEVYWTQQAMVEASGEIVIRLYRASRGASRQELVAEELAIGFGDIAFDDDNVYWTVSDLYHRCPAMCTGGGVVRTKPLSGGEARTIAGEEEAPGPLTLDAERVYWGTHTSIRSARKDGSDLKSFVAVPGGPTSIAVDDEAVYWATYAERGTVGRATK